MIVYSLRCSKGHAFDEWFASGSQFDEKAAGGALACPECGDTKIAKAIMAPRVSSGSGAAPVEPACGSCAQGGSCPWAA